jgi:putative addiction module component (TIGR02574 family)
MTEEAAELLRRARALSSSERAELACSLIESLDEIHEKSVQEAWDGEIVLRMQDLNAGKVKAVSLTEARRRLSSFLD